VWPPDTALCAAGLARYGFREEAGLLAGALFDAAEHFGHRLPVLFGGFAREQVPVPVSYPQPAPRRPGPPRPWSSSGYSSDWTSGPMTCTSTPPCQPGSARVALTTSRPADASTQCP